MNEQPQAIVNELVDMLRKAGVTEPVHQKDWLDALRDAVAAELGGQQQEVVK